MSEEGGPVFNNAITNKFKIDKVIKVIELFNKIVCIGRRYISENKV